MDIASVYMEAKITKLMIKRPPDICRAYIAYLVVRSKAYGLFVRILKLRIPHLGAGKRPLHGHVCIYPYMPVDYYPQSRLSIVPDVPAKTIETCLGGLCRSTLRMYLHVQWYRYTQTLKYPDI